MGLIRQGFTAMRDLVTDQYRGLYAVDAMDADVLAVRAGKRIRDRKSLLRREDTGVITDGSVIVVGEGQCMIVTDQVRITEVCAEAGEFVYENDGTPNPIPYRLSHPKLGLEIDISLRCFGEYSYRITDPLTFFENVCGNTADTFLRGELESQLRAELLTALQAAFAGLSAQGVWYSDLPAHAVEITRALGESLTDAWQEKRGISIVTFGISSVNVAPEDAALIREVQKKILLGDVK